jgi:enoyl-CoA hydratase/carnithine racemase
VDATADVVTAVDGSVFIVTINRPARRNAVNRSVANGIAAGMAQLDERDDLAVGIITGAGGTFCAGLDLKAFVRGESASVPGRGFAGLVEAPPRKPLIAAVEGWALGGGFEIALACDLVVAGRGARFGLPEVRRGVAARGGAAIRLPRRLPYAMAMELLLTGEPIDAGEGHRLGLLNRVVADGDALSCAVELARTIARNAPLAVAASKRVAIDSADWPAAVAFVEQRKHLDPVFASDDAREGATAFAERRHAVWRGR